MNNPNWKRPYAIILDDVESLEEAPPRERRISEREVELALDAAYEAGLERGIEVGRSSFLRKDGEAERPDTAAKQFAERQRVKLEMAKAVGQTIAALAQIIDETGGIR